MSFATKIYRGRALVDGQAAIDVASPAKEVYVATVAAAGMDDDDDAQRARESARDAFPHTPISAYAVAKLGHNIGLAKGAVQIIGVKYHTNRNRTRRRLTSRPARLSGAQACHQAIR